MSDRVLLRGFPLWVCLLTVLLLLTTSGRAIAAPVSNPGNGEESLARLGRTALAVAAATNPDGFMGKGLALVDIWLKGSTTGQEKATNEAEPLSPEQPPTDDPSEIPPASAGTNGSPYDHPTAAGSRVIVAHSLNSVEGEDSGPITTLVSGIALAPPSAPEPIQRAINSANMISRTPYVWGGGHQSWYSNGYDCSGAVSFALYGAGMLSQPLASGQLESWGEPGPGRWLTVYANAGHAYAVIAGLRWDTVGNAKGSGPRWHPDKAPPEGFVARHYPGF